MIPLFLLYLIPQDLLTHQQFLAVGTEFGLQISQLPIIVIVHLFIYA